MPSKTISAAKYAESEFRAGRFPMIEIADSYGMGFYLRAEGVSLSGGNFTGRAAAENARSNALDKGRARALRNAR